MTINLVVLMGLVPLLALASGEYKPKPYKPDPYQPKKPPHNWDTSTYKPADKTYKYFKEKPRQRSEKDVKVFVYSLPRKGVSINSLSYQQAAFTLKGTYKTKTALDLFVDRMKKSIRSEKKLELKTHKTSFAGSNTLHYEIVADNKF